MAWESSTRSKRLPSDWTKRRKVVLRRDGYQCTVMVSENERCPTYADEVDHVVRGDNHSYDNLASICKYHHGLKTQVEAKEAAKVAREEFKAQHGRPTVPHPGLVQGDVDD